MKSKASESLDELESAYWLGEDVCRHVCGFDVLQGNDILHDFLPNEMILNIDVLGLLMVFWIFHESNTALNVRIDNRRLTYVIS